MAAVETEAPDSRIILAADSSLSCLRPAMVTLAPCWAKRSAMRWPMPLPPPVTKADLPWRRRSRKTLGGVEGTREEYHAGLGGWDVVLNHRRLSGWGIFDRRRQRSKRDGHGDRFQGGNL